MKTIIAVVTTSRADYSHLYWPLRELEAHPDVDLKLIVMASHLSPEYGYTIREIEKDRFPIAARLECLINSDSDVAMAKTIGLAVLSLADTLSTMRPDLLLLIADRYEMLAPATVALALRIPIAHIEGGELSQGAIDDAVRNALTKMSHVHFTSTDTARDRVISMGEEPWRVHRAGAPSLDHLERSELVAKSELELKLKINLSLPTIVVAYHPVTLLSDTNEEAVALFEALQKLPHQIIFCYPNADTGSYELASRIRLMIAERKNTFLFTNLSAIDYWSLLRHATLFVGNSSSGIMETASFKLPTVNIGKRQQGRERPKNVLDVAAVTTEILEAVHYAQSAEFQAAVENMANPYGDGHASERIIRVLTSLPSRDKLLFKLDSQVAS